jgi:hypothetical protein
MGCIPFFMGYGWAKKGDASNRDAQREKERSFFLIFMIMIIIAI